MKNNNYIKVIIADASVIVRSGLTSVLKRLTDYSFTINEISNVDTLQMFIRLHTPDLIIINPQFSINQNFANIKKDFPKIKLIALLSSFIDPKSLGDFDDTISIFDDVESINSKICEIFKTDSEEEEISDTEQLSPREKEIIGFVVKGFTNKAISDHLSISIHTVITHRRNIAKKLQIHSSAGLAIYAIVNKIVEIQDIKEGL